MKTIREIIAIDKVGDKTAEEYVTNRKPQSECHPCDPDGHAGFKFQIRPSLFDWLGYGHTPDEAWEDAAANLLNEEV